MTPLKPCARPSSTPNGIEPEDVEKYGLKQIDKKYEWIWVHMGINSSVNCIYFIGRIWS